MECIYDSKAVKCIILVTRGVVWIPLLWFVYGMYDMIEKQWSAQYYWQDERVDQGQHI